VGDNVDDAGRSEEEEPSDCDGRVKHRDLVCSPALDQEDEGEETKRDGDDVFGDLWFGDSKTSDGAGKQEKEEALKIRK
jgi:hypothetical protein